MVENAGGELRLCSMVELDCGCVVADDPNPFSHSIPQQEPHQNSLSDW
ncbi:hypothetical protein DSL72_002055 [Monilinia vaccinii-corymbosi]|uniref:Uncharacterized protein n=1 Tax=Monilinia vaccinii-corymbosi TaxID=61207 RepID=A0A8A3PBK1_9HELO|nr:hypothetical protein DSL72_002055 [Monilinia vaccinii-corymbosi]